MNYLLPFYYDEPGTYAPEETAPTDSNEASQDTQSERYENRVACTVHSHVYSEIYQQVAAGNERGVSALLLAWRNYLTIGEAFDLMQTTLCLIAAKRVVTS